MFLLTQKWKIGTNFDLSKDSRYVLFLVYFFDLDDTSIVTEYANDDFSVAPFFKGCVIDTNSTLC